MLGLVKTREMKGTEDLAAICGEWQHDINVYLSDLRTRRSNLDTALLNDSEERWRY